MGTSVRYNAVRTKLTKKSIRNVMTTDWFTESPTPFGPGAVFRPR
jgi:hypothetical protein